MNIPDSPDELKALWNLHDSHKRMAMAALESGYQLGVMRMVSNATQAIVESGIEAEKQAYLLEMVHQWADLTTNEASAVVTEIMRRALDE